MKRILNINNIQINEILIKKYDLGIFASGYEERSTYLYNNIDTNNIYKTLIIGFTEETLNNNRLINDNLFNKNINNLHFYNGANNDKGIYTILNSIEIKNKKEFINILVDYSSMSKIWYASIINWALNTELYDNIVIDMIYSIGTHREMISKEYIDKILTIPGCEGNIRSFPKSIAIFGLGFDGETTLSAYDYIEPDLSFTFLASPAAFSDYPEITKRKNEYLLKNSKINLELPLENVEYAYIMLFDLIKPFKNKFDISLIPMGPKPHVLASILVALNNLDIACLHIKCNKRPESIIPTGNFISTRIYIAHKNNNNYLKTTCI